MERITSADEKAKAYVGRSCLRGHALRNRGSGCVERTRIQRIIWGKPDPAKYRGAHKEKEAIRTRAWESAA